jgi:hypothetical protein
LLRVLVESEQIFATWGSAVDDGTAERAIFLEYLTPVDRLDASGAAANWSPDAMDAVLHAAARWHAAFWGGKKKSLGWAGSRLTTLDMIADEPLWCGLLNDAHARFPILLLTRYGGDAIG